MYIAKKGILIPALALCLVFFSAGSGLFAQESAERDTWSEQEDQDDQEEADPWDYQTQVGSVAGDKIFNIDIGLMLGLGFINGHGQSIPLNLGIGGAGMLSYDYMLSKHFSLGAEVSGSFNSTLGANILYLVPFGLRAGLHFDVGRFSIPSYIMLGASNHFELGYTYFGFAMKLQSGVFWRFNDEWSFGLNASWLLLPEIHSTPEETVWGNFLMTTLAVRYHF